ncbi:MAG TPA: DUF1579 family protein [Acidimicrobiia bacterium]|nr:DUF1579 family protein [Acidimicrobiia bacterium]
MTITELADTIPRPIIPGAEMEELRRFHRDGTWNGRIHPGGMGPGTPAQLARGVARHHWIQDGRWVVGDYEQDQMLEDGTFVLNWQLHWVCGWNPRAGEYMATIADNYGSVALLRGRIVGDQMVFESTGEQPPFLKFTWELSSRGSILWRNEMSLDGSAWMLVEDYEIEPEA